MVPRLPGSRQPPPGSVRSGAALGQGAGGPPCVLGSGGVPRLPCRVTPVPSYLSVCPRLSAVPRAGCVHLSSPLSTFRPSLRFSPRCLSHHPPPSQGLGREAYAADDVEVRSWGPCRHGARRLRRAAWPLWEPALMVSPSVLVNRRFKL